MERQRRRTAAAARHDRSGDVACGQAVTRFLLSHTAADPVSFHMPGHKGAALYRKYGYGAFLDRMLDCDITEIPGADNLFQTEGVIRATMDRYRAIYGARESFLLVGGSSAGILAAILACVPPGAELILARNCHKSVLNALRLAGGKPVYAYPELLPSYGISGPIRPETVAACLQTHPNAAAVILPSPNYYGICSDISAIARIVHAAGKCLIVDQAHGAHLKLFDQYARDRHVPGQPDGLQTAGVGCAEDQGADVVVESTHKTLGTLTQSAVVNLCTDRVDPALFADKLQMIESTSPSYLLMASLDLNADLLERHGAQLIRNWEADLRWFYAQAARIPGLRVMTHPMLDYTKINLDLRACGLDGLALEAQLRRRGIFAELAAGDLVMCMSGIGNRRRDYQRLLDALREIARSGPAETAPGTAEDGFAGQALLQKKRPQRPVPARWERVPLEMAVDRVCAAAIIPYPPGIPLICPGEEMDAETLAYVGTLRQRGVHVMGVDRDGCVHAGLV